MIGLTFLASVFLAGVMLWPLWKMPRWTILVRKTVVFAVFAAALIYYSENIGGQYDLTTMLSGILGYWLVMVAFFYGVGGLFVVPYRKIIIARALDQKAA